jgi:aldose 1-epimerase
MIKFYACPFIVMLLVSCGKKTNETPAVPESTTRMNESIQVDSLGVMPSGEVISQYTLVNKNGLQMQVINLGGTITSLKVPDRQGKIEEVILGCDSLQDYLDGTPFFGCIVGRYGNRIAKGSFELDGTRYELAKNNDGNHLHGGLKGFDKAYWNIEPIPSDSGQSIGLTYLSPDMEEGYPGNLSVEVVYTLTDDNKLAIAYRATTDKPTVVNLTNHTYFNLTGDARRNILDHELVLHATKFIPVDAGLIPVGTLEDVAGTPFDFREARKMGEHIDDNHPQIVNGRGYDHCWVISGNAGELRLGASVYEPQSGRVMEMYTTEPGVQFYTGNFLDGTQDGKGGKMYNKRDGFCLETEHFPDSPNQKSFPSVVLRPGEVYQTRTVYAFSTK